MSNNKNDEMKTYNDRIDVLYHLYDILKKEVEDRMRTLPMYNQVKCKGDQFHFENTIIKISELIEEREIIYERMKKTVIERNVKFPDPNRVCIFEMLEEY